MKKSKPFVTIPVGCVCMPLNEVIYPHTELANVRSANADMAQLIKQRDYRVSELESQVSELGKKLSDTEKELKRENDAKLYWYKKYMDITTGSEKGEPNAQAKTS